jgi:hypothetical protein
VRYVPPGTRKIYWVTTIATYTAPTRSELNAGIDLTAEIASITGFTVTSATTEVPDLSTRFSASVPARITAAASALTFYASSTSSDVRTVLPRDTAGYAVFLWEGDITGQKMDVFPSKVTAESVAGDMEAPQQVSIEFAITKIPALNVVIP